MKRARLNLYLEPAHAGRLTELATMRGVSKSAIVALALTSYLSPAAFDRLEANFAERLDNLVRQLGKLERDQNILIETLALYIRYHLSVGVPIPDAQHEAARAQGRERFAQFVAQLARHILRGNSLVRELDEELFPKGSEFMAEAAGKSPAGPHS